MIDNIDRSQYFKEYGKKNREKMLLNLRKWRAENQEKYKQSYKDYHLKHKEERHKYASEYHKTHKEARRENRIKTYIKNKEQEKAYSDVWRKTPIGKLSHSKSTDYRNRNLGSNMLNNWFNGCERHHVTKQDIICIPKDIHHAYIHTHKKLESMKKINIIAWDYMERSVL